MKEIERIDIQNNGELPDSAQILIKVVNVENPKRILENAKEIMKTISQFAYTNTWPNDDKWEELLPNWFVKSMTSKTIEEIMSTEGQWHFGSWIESMYHRAWEWYSSKIESNTITIVLETLNIPYVFEQFFYIFYAQGVSLNNISSIDDIYDKV